MKPLRLGNIVIERLAEIEVKYFDPHWLYQNLDEAMLRRHMKTLGPLAIHPETLELGLSYHSFVIRARGKTILVDTCNGNAKPRPKMPEYHNLQSDLYLSNLSRLGLTPDDVDVVMCTHLHCDHVGWHTQLVDGKWVPTFPRARYLFARDEFEHFNAQYLANPSKPVSHGSFQDCILPIVEAGLADIVDMDHLVVGNVEEGVWIEPAPGHTPGHITVHVKGGGREAILTGDIIHHAILIMEPSLETRFDMDKARGDATRLKLLGRLADTGNVLLAAHFCSPTAGCIASDSRGFRFAYLAQ